MKPRNAQFFLVEYFPMTLQKAMGAVFSRLVPADRFKFTLAVLSDVRGCPCSRFLRVGTEGLGFVVRHAWAPPLLSDALDNRVRSCLSGRRGVPSRPLLVFVCGGV